MKKVSRILLAVLALSMMTILFTACGKDDDGDSKKSAKDKQADYEALLKDASKIDFTGKGAQALAESKGIKIDETVAENGDFQSVMGSDKFSLTVTNVGGKVYVKGFYNDKDGNKQEFAYSVPEGSTIGDKESTLSVDPSGVASFIKDENGNAVSDFSDVKYVKTEGGKDYVTATITTKGDDPESIPATLLFDEKTQKLAGLIVKPEGGEMTVNFGSFNLTVDASAYTEGTETEIMTAMLSAMASAGTEGGDDEE